jgi:hypothetical protein
MTALIHTHEGADAQRIARTLDSLRPCDEALVIDHGANAEVARVAREHGANLKQGVPGVSPGTYLVDARYDWILCLLPREALSEALEASLFQWKQADHEEERGFAIALREETAGQWRHLKPETRLVNRNKVNWTAELPPEDPKAERLEGDLLRFSTP